MHTGFPNHPPQRKVEVSFLLIGLFGLSFGGLLGAGWAVRQAFLLTRKAGPLLGLAANLAYMVGFMLFFLFVLVLRNLT